MASFSAVLASLLLLFVAFHVAPISSLSCSAQWQCTSVSDDYNYVACVDGQCTCLTSNGFVGSANETDHCRCVSPRSVSWSGSTPYCISYPLCASAQVAEDRVTKLKAKVALVYDNLVYPTASAILSGQVSVTDLFAANTKGRIDPVGTFDNYATLTEYYYGLAATVAKRVTSVDIIDLFGAGNEVFVRVNIFFEYWDGVTPPQNLTQSGRLLFDDDDLISSVDLIIHNLGKASPPPDVPTTEVICGILQQTCPPEMDPTGYYANFTDCFDFWTTQIPAGSFGEAASNSVACRIIHALLTPFNPEVHCPHAGKTGGGKCIDTPYDSYYLTSY